MKNKMTHLRDHLFEAIERVKDDENPMELDRAKTVCDLAHALIHTARVEVEFIKATEQVNAGSEFFDIEPVNYRPKQIRGV
jgi:uncharacterized damage-inducible protein DinB